MKYQASPASEAMSYSTLASSNHKTEGEMIMVISDEEEELQGKLVKSSNLSQSKERKLSNDNEMLPPRAKEGSILRPSKFVSKATINEKSASAAQQPLKPMTILGFLQQSTKGGLQGCSKRRVEKADFKSLDAFSLLTSTGKTAAKTPSFTMG